MADAERGRRARVVSALGLGLAVVGDGLLRGVTLGVNVFLWTALLGIALWSLPGARAWRPRLFVVLAVACSAGLAWRRAPELQAFDMLAVLLLVGLAVVACRPGRMDGAWQVSAGLLGAMSRTTVGVIVLAAEDVPWSAASMGRGLRPALAVLRGLAMATPVILVFGLLLGSADPVFAALAREELLPDPMLVAAHLFFVSVMFVSAVGLLRQAALPPSGPAWLPNAPASLALGITEAALLVGLVDLLFAGFVGVQVQYLFGGADFVRVVPGLTWSEYARRGFFELVAVTALALPLLLVVGDLLHGDARGVRVFRALAALQVALLLVMLASALQRMMFYEEQYGLTRLRLYTSAFMGWLALVLAWFVVTVLRGRRRVFLPGAFATGLAALAALHAFDPDAAIARVNAQRAAAGRGFDVDYAAALSDDALPALMAARASLPVADRDRLDRALASREAPSRDWRSWSLATARARAALGR